jgi:hypothetical protein
MDTPTRVKQHLPENISKYTLLAIKRNGVPNGLPWCWRKDEDGMGVA